MPEQLVKTIGLQELKSFLRDVPERLFDVTKTQLGKSSLSVQKAVQDNFTLSSSGSVGGRLHSRTGALRRSILTSNKGNTLGTLSSSIFSKKIYAPIQEIGGTISAIDKYVRVPGGPYLNIPLSANKTASGVTRLSASEVFGSGGSLFKSKKGNWIVSLGGKPMFVLKKSVEIPARLGMQKAAEDEVPTLLSSLQVEITKRLKQ